MVSGGVRSFQVSEHKVGSNIATHADAELSLQTRSVSGLVLCQVKRERTFCGRGSRLAELAFGLVAILKRFCSHLQEAELFWLVIQNFCPSLGPYT